MPENMPTTTAQPESPRFPHHNVEASHQLGLPDLPAVHLAVTMLADRLVALPHHSSQPTQQVRLTALRVASRAVLEGQPIEWAAAHFLSRLNDAAEPDWAAAEAACLTHRTDWLGHAMVVLLSNGVDLDPDARRTATMYGWDESRIQA